MRQASFVDADLEGASMLYANLESATMLGAILEHADLSQANMPRVELDNAQLSHARLKTANLSRARLDEAILLASDLRECTLVGARLGHANLQEANLRRANLQGCDLTGTNLYKTILAEADISNSILSSTTFTDVDLSRTVGLGLCYHEGPSFIDQFTIIKSGKLPIRFLQGLGLSNARIAYSHKKIDTTTRFPKCFISYAGADEEFATKLYRSLQKLGVRCWFALENMRVGDPIKKTVEAAIDSTDRLILILSKASIESDWVEHEVKCALEREEKQHGLQILLPIRIDNTIKDAQFGWAKRLHVSHGDAGRHIGDFSGWRDAAAYKKVLNRFVQNLALPAENRPGFAEDSNL